MDNPRTKEEIRKAFKVIKAAMQADHPSERGSYAHGWHCNIATMCYDAMLESSSDTDIHCARAIANDAASRFMKICFGVKTNDRREDTPAKKG